MMAYGAVSAALLAGGLWLCDAVLQPVPMPLGGAAVFGWLGYLFAARRRPLRGLLIGFAIGAAIGVIGHVRSHIVEDRVESIASMVLHVLGDLGISVLGAAPVLAISLGWMFAAGKRASRLPSA